MIKVHSVSRRERDGKLFAIVNVKDVPAGVERSWAFERIAHGLVDKYEPYYRGLVWDGPADWPPLDYGPAGYTKTWVRLDDICPVKVLHATEYGGRIACVVDARMVPIEVNRSRARWGVTLADFIAEHHPAEAKDNRYRGSAGDLGEALCWVFLDEFFGGASAERAVAMYPLTVTPAPVLIDGLTREQCFERYAVAVKSERRLALTSPQLAAAREEWSLRLRTKVQAAEAEAKRVADATVGWNPYEGGD